MRSREHRFVLIATLITSASAAVFAEPTIELPRTLAGNPACEVQLGQTIAPIDAESAAVLNADVQPKGEFESSEQYKARLDAGGRQLPATLFVPVMLDKQYIKYDADAGKFIVEEYAIDNKNLSWNALQKNPRAPWVSDLPMTNYIDLVVKWAEVDEGQYAATNVYGAKVMVRQTLRRTIGILERPAQGRESLFFPDSPWTGTPLPPIAEIPVDATKAAAWRSNLRAAVLIEPRPPFVMQGIKDWGRPRFDRPQEITEKITAIIADIRCVVLTDEKNWVVASIATR